MTRHRKIIAAAGLGAIACALLLGAAISSRSSITEWLTDGAAVRERAESAPSRRVLWGPSTPARHGEHDGAVVGEGAVDEYEARISPDGMTLLLVRRRPGSNADVFAARRTPAGWTEPAPIDAINSEHDELGPEVSSDGTALYFYSDRPGGFGGYDLWVSRAMERDWGTPVNLGPAVNTAWNEYGPALAPDRATLYFSSNRARDAAPPTGAWKATLREERGRRDYDLYSSDVRAGEPAPARAIALLNTGSDEGAPAISPGGDFLYFASDRAGGSGGFDLWRARILRGTVGAPENLGGSVNSAFNDLDPGPSSDGFRLHFSSDRPLPDVDPAPVISNAPHEPVSVARYALWTSVSREVFIEHERDPRGGRLASMWESMWPWLVVLALMTLVLILLLRLVRDEAWRRRLGQLSLLARCVLVSIMIHALAATGMAVWKVGSGLIDAVRRDGGTRVILTSSGASPDGAAGATDQLFAPVSSEAAPQPILTLVSAAFVAPAHPEVRVEVMPPTLMVSAPALREPGFADAPPAPESPAVPMSAAAARDEHDVPLPPTPAPLAVHAEMSAATPAFEPRPIAPRVPTPDLTPAPAVPATPAPVRVVDAALPGPGFNEALAHSPVPTAPAFIPPRAEAHAEPRYAMPAASTARAVPEVTESLPIAPVLLRAGVPAPAAKALSATVASPAPALAAMEVKPGLIDSDRPAASAAPTPNMAASASVPRRTALFDRVAIPSSSPLSPGTRAASEESSELSLPTQHLAPLRAATSTRRASAEPPTPVDIPAPAPAIGAESPKGSTALESLPASNPGAPGTRTTLTQTVPARASIDSGGLRLPELPAAPVTPVETFAQRDPDVRADVLREMGGSPETERAVGLALEWFARHQEPDGRWTGRDFDARCGTCGGGAEFDADTAMTGLVLQCFLGAGHTHKAEGPYRDVVARALRWLVDRQDPSGDLRHGETMYGQTVATVALCEALAMTSDQDLAGPARRAVNFVLGSTSRGAGRGRDTAVLGWLVMTVESARRAGIEVSHETIRDAEAWLAYVTVAPGRYAYARDGAPSVEMTAEAMFVRQLVGHSRAEPMMGRSADYVANALPKWSQGAPTHHWYYATLALFEHQGDAWNRWNRALAPELLAHQRRDGPAAGSWDPHDRSSKLGGRIYQTAVCALSLEVYYRYKPK